MTEDKENYWKEKYADIHIRLTNRIAELEQENKILKSNTNVLNDYITKNEQLKTNIDSLVKKNESLKQQHNDDTEEIAKLGLDVAILERENKELKEENSLLSYNLHLKEQENEELKKDIKQHNEWLDEERESREYWCKQSLPYRKYRSALEEIRTYLNTLSSIDSDFTSTETYLRITDKINEVLQ